MPWRVDACRWDVAPEASLRPTSRLLGYPFAAETEPDSADNFPANSAADLADDFPADSDLAGGSDAPARAQLPVEALLLEHQTRLAFFRHGGAQRKKPNARKVRNRTEWKAAPNLLITITSIRI